MATKESLGGYRRKRDFEQTPEPSGRRRRRRAKRPAFVVQEHHATTRHFDFRLEANGVLKSWAVPKGLSTDPRDKRLAMPTEDHPLEYGDFEGVIPEGQYGAGAVIVWDAGSYRNLTEEDGEEVPIEQALENGHAVVWLDGRKVRGGYALNRIAKGKDERWLVVKRKDEEADARRNPAKTEPQSVLSGKTVEEVRKGTG